MKPIAAFAFLLACLASPVHADTYPRQPGVDAVHYVFRLSLLQDDSSQIRGESTVDLRFVSDGVRDVFLDLASAVDGKGMTVSAVSSGGQPVPFTHQDDRLRLSLPVAATAGSEVSFTVTYRGVPAAGLRLIPNIHGERSAFSENWPNRARQWLPMIDHPYDKATGEFIVTAPAEYQVVANGLLIQTIDLANGLRRTHWKQSVPIASWLFALGVSHFAVHHAGQVRGVALQSWVFPQDGEKAYAVFETAARQAFEFFSDHIAPYPYEKLANVQAAGLGGGTEHASAIFYGEKGVAAGRAPVVHEVAHQWWGDAVTESDWDDVWLSEGFATYFTHLCNRHYQGHDAFVAGLKRDITTVMQAEQKSPDTPVVHRNLSDMTRVLNRFVYQKGGWVLHMLHGLVGEEVFWAGIRDYYRRYENGNVTTDDFRRVMERVSGRDLSWFFRQWLNRSGIPRIEGTWRYDAVRKQVEVTLAQTQPGDAYRLPLQIRLVFNPPSAARVESAELADRQGTFTFAAETEPVSVVLDPGTWMLYEPGPFEKRQ
jgi:aminopeptidase N